MSQFTFLASNAPLENVENPHLKRLSVNEAVTQGIERPKMLPDNIDRDKPNVLLWVDDEESIGDLAIFEAKWCKYKSYSPNMEYNSIIQWVYTDERAKQLISYIRKHLETTDSVEIWHICLDSDNEIIGKPENIIIDVNELTVSQLAKYLKNNNDDSRPVRILIKKK